VITLKNTQSGRDLSVCPYCGMIVDKSTHDCPVKRKRNNHNARIARQNQTITEKALTSQRWRSFRKKIILRDGGECQRCLIKLHKHTYDDLTVHHIQPRVNHPELMYDESNCVTLCRECNLAMGLNGIDFDWNTTKATINLDDTLHF
jgi:5-methylcytosine-specific restriction endonuclease McrA